MNQTTKYPRSTRTENGNIQFKLPSDTCQCSGYTGCDTCETYRTNENGEGIWQLVTNPCFGEGAGHETSGCHDITEWKQIIGYNQTRITARNRGPQIHRIAVDHGLLYEDTY